MIHITKDDYRRIQEEIDRQADSDGGPIEIEVTVGDEGQYLLTVEGWYTADYTETRFSDGAWGNWQTFTEYNAHYEVTDLTAECSDEDGESVETDFDVEQLQLEW